MLVAAATLNAHSDHCSHLTTQEYNSSKRVEHAFKSMIHDSRTISAVSPVAYSRRFQEFLLNIFRPAVTPSEKRSAAGVEKRASLDLAPMSLQTTIQQQ